MNAELTVKTLRPDDLFRLGKFSEQLLRLMTLHDARYMSIDANDGSVDEIESISEEIKSLLWSCSADAAWFKTIIESHPALIDISLINDPFVSRLSLEHRAHLERHVGNAAEFGRNLDDFTTHAIHYAAHIDQESQALKGSGLSGAVPLSRTGLCFLLGVGVVVGIATGTIAIAASAGFGIGLGCLGIA